MVTEQGYGVAETARKLAINAKMLSRWTRELTEKEPAAFAGKGHPSPAQEALYPLREENEPLRIEREVLKKALSFLACESWNLLLNRFQLPVHLTYMWGSRKRHTPHYLPAMGRMLVRDGRACTGSRHPTFRTCAEAA